MTFREKMKLADKIPTDFRNASKQPWECDSYEEFVASLPEDEQEADYNYRHAINQDKDREKRGNRRDHP